jgi:hypothetical protein
MNCIKCGKKFSSAEFPDYVSAEEQVTNSIGSAEWLLGGIRKSYAEGNLQRVKKLCEYINRDIQDILEAVSSKAPTRSDASKSPVNQSLLDLINEE